ncbi:MAG: hypothetical protein IKA61_05365, partial [Clostridia bacterium]|nr:hypothetical protein [Clostridia bacterium]
MKKNKKVKKLYIVLLLVVVVASIMLAIAVSSVDNQGLLAIRKEVLYVIAAFLMIVPIAILVISLIALLGGKQIVVETAIIPDLGVNQPQAASQTQKEKKEPVNAEGRPIGRFSTLIKLDENRKSFKRAGYDKHVTLQNLCENFRNYAARHLR